MSITRSLAEFVVNTRYEELPQKIVHETKRLLLDSIGCALGALSVEKGTIAVELAKELGGKSEASIIGVNDRISSTNAAFANGELISALDSDASVSGHVPPIVIPPALALAEKANAGGPELILAAVIGCEVGSRMVTSIPAKRTTVYPIINGTHEDRKSAREFSWACAIIGAAASAGKVLGLDVDKMEDAFGLVAHMCPLPGWNSQSLSPPVGMHKYDMAGWLAQAGVVAALLAQKGYTGQKSVLDGEHGFWWFYGAMDCDIDSIVRDIGKAWNTLGWTAKKFPICGGTGTSLSAFLEILAEENIQPHEIETIDVKIDPQFNFPMWLNNDVKTCVDAQFSIAYPFAAAAYYPLPEGLGPKWQTPEVIGDTRVQRLMRKVNVGFYDMELFPLPEPQSVPRLVKVDVAARGRTYTKEGIWASQWHKDSGPSEEDLVEKFRVNASMVLSSEQIEKALKILMGLEKMDTVSKLMQSLCIS